MPLSALASELQQRLQPETPLGGIVKFAVGDDGAITIHGRDGKNTVTLGDEAADCTVTITREDLAALLSGELQPAVAYMQGKIAVDGDLSLAMHLSQLL